MNSKTLSPWKTTRQQLSQFASLKEHIFWNQLPQSKGIYINKVILQTTSPQGILLEMSK